MPNRRKFLTRFAYAAIGSTAYLSLQSCKDELRPIPETSNKPIIISTWANLEANKAAWNELSNGGNALDAVEAGARIPEADPNDTSVGFGGFPDINGDVTLDACIMDMHGNCGSVCYLKHIKHPISVARKVMEETDHVILAGQGALNFALNQGFQKENLLSENAKKEYDKWKLNQNEKKVINKDMHDTIGILAIDNNGDISGACTTSGLAFKLEGRVGDSPIIGAGMYADNEVGAAAATGKGEEVLKSLGSFLIVELMRQGMTPQEACEEAITRIVKKHKDVDFQVGYIALNKQGDVGAYAINKGFEYAVHTDKYNQAIKSDSHLS